MRSVSFCVAVTLVAASAPCAARTVEPLPAGKLNPGYHHPDFPDVRSGPAHDAMARAHAAGTLQSLPSWSHAFSINGQSYNYTLLGTDPALGAATITIPTVLVPIRLRAPDVVINGKKLVLDATHSMPAILHSPIFTPAPFDSGTLQFTDAMLHAEFPQAPAGWHLNFAATVAPTLDITAPPGTVKAYQSSSGAVLGVVMDDRVLDGPIAREVRSKYTSNTYVIFVTYNALENDALGYHSAHLSPDGTSATVYAYNSWLVGVKDLFSIPSPDADTFAHEMAETVHDALGLSRTLKWGDWFNKNKCFQSYIETGDAVEDATGPTQNYHQTVMVNGKPVIYTLQTEAMLQWFTREFPSSALHGAYSFPGETALLGPAPFTCAAR